jgi:uncharacterized protein YneF (UPF0154 family)
MMWALLGFVVGLLVGHFGTMFYIARRWPWGM